MGLPLLDGSLFDFIYFRAIEAFSRPPVPVSSLIFTPGLCRLGIGVLSTAGGPLLGANYSRKVAALR